MSFTYGGISTDDMTGVAVTPLGYPNMGGLQLDTVETAGRDGRFYGGSRMTVAQFVFRVTISGESQQQADQRRLEFLRMLDPSSGPRSLRLDNTQAWHYPRAVVGQEIVWEKHADQAKVIYDGELTFETTFDPAMRQIEPNTVSGTGQVEFIAEAGSTVSYPTIIAESGGDFRVRVNDFMVDLYDTPPNTFAVLNWDEYKFYTADADEAQSVVYEWEGETLRSPSVKRRGREIVAQNLFHNPSFERNLGSINSGSRTSLDRTQFSSGVSSGRYGLTAIVGQNANNANAYVAQSFDISPEMRGKWVAWSILIRRSGSGLPSVRPYVTGDDFEPQWFDGFELTTAPLPEQTRHAYAVQIPENTTWLQIWYRFTNTPAGGNPSSGNAHTDDWIASVADTEEDALAQVEEYFDGSFSGYIVPGERKASLVNNMSHYERPAIYPGDRVEVEVTDLSSNQPTPVIVYPNHRRI